MISSEVCQPQALASLANKKMRVRVDHDELSEVCCRETTVLSHCFTCFVRKRVAAVFWNGYKVCSPEFPPGSSRSIHLRKPALTGRPPGSQQSRCFVDKSQRLKASIPFAGNLSRSNVKHQAHPWHSVGCFLVLFVNLFVN